MSRDLSRTARVLACVSIPLLVGVAALAAPRLAGAADEKPAAPATAPKAFASVQDAAKALVEACKKNDDAALLAMVGSDAADVIESGKDPRVHADREKFSAAADKKLSFEEKDGKTTIVVGEDDWPLPIPLVKSGDKWQFDAVAGRAEILARRIGKNELRAIRTCRDYVAAQVDYASKDRDGDRVREYAQRLLSSSGAHDGLWWPTTDASDPSPLSDELAAYKNYLSNPSGAPTPFMGYYWRILTAQGPDAPGGAHGYLINGNMVAGFALLGVPARYRVSGVMTLVVSHHGTIYEKDLGADTHALAKDITAFDPDETWTAVTEKDLAEAQK